MVIGVQTFDHLADHAGGPIMGTEIVRVPRGFAHPADDAGYPIPGAHCELLYRAGPDSCICYQLYENVTEGTPISPAFETLTELSDWCAGRAGQMKWSRVC
jgi:hypothetical protein